MTSIETRTLRLEIGSALRELREGAGFTQTDAAAVVGMSRAHLSAIEQGINDPQVETVLRLLDIYGCRMDLTPLWKNWVT